MYVSVYKQSTRSVTDQNSTRPCKTSSITCWMPHEVRVLARPPHWGRSLRRTCCSKMSRLSLLLRVTQTTRTLSVVADMLSFCLLLTHSPRHPYQELRGQESENTRVCRSLLHSLSLSLSLYIYLPIYLSIHLSIYLTSYLSM